MQFLRVFGQFILRHKRRIAVGCAAIIIVLLVTGSVFILKDLPSPSKLTDTSTVPYSTHIYDRNGSQLYEIFREQNRTAIKLATLPSHVKWATISIEDKNFYQHQGVSVFGGMLRAVKETILRQKLQGGSTITQQLVKSALLTPERTIQRKIKEIILALLVERTYTKDQIIEMYLNQVPYGGTAWGIEEASKLYFNKRAQKLTLAQAALLAGLPQAPSQYSPYVNPQTAIARQKVVLKQMLVEKHITQQQYDKALKEKLIFTRPKNTILAPHFVFYVKSLLEQEYGIKRVQEDGLNVYTTLDYPIQKDAETILKKELDEVETYDIGNGALLVTRPSTGEILTMIGSKDFFDGQYGAYNVTTALRQPGSSIKPLNFAVGLERRLVTPATMFLDIPTCFAVPDQKGYCPHNYDGQFRGPVQLRFALANSLNIPAVKMLAINGVTDFIASSSAMGISTFKDPSQYGLSLTLGGGEIHMTDMAVAFSSFPNQGVAKSLIAILKVTDRFGNVLYQYKDPNLVKDVSKPLDYPNFLLINGKRVFSKDTSYLISHILLDNGARSAAFGTSSYLVVNGHQAVSVKTGTTDDLRDNWTIGYTPNFMTLVWVGNNDNKPMNPYLVSGVTGAAPIWNKVMQRVLKNQKDMWPQKPDTIIGLEVCDVTGLKPTINPDGTKSCSTRFEYFAKGTEPSTQGAIKQHVLIDKSTGDLAKPGQTDNVEDQEKTVVKDNFSTYCVDCTHDSKNFTTVPIR
ncbi:MAG: transglycosylase domain-containing protein [Patescibacteria group bacterium]|jgi:penicillin-binding protein 1C